MNKLEHLLYFEELDADELAMVAGGPEPDNDPRKDSDDFPEVVNEPPP